MFLFIGDKGDAGPVGPAFKYISCSYLSEWYSPNNKDYKNLNTSHVLIYLGYHFLVRKDGTIFKYISCSYLSSTL